MRKPTENPSCGIYRIINNLKCYLACVSVDYTVLSVANIIHAAVTECDDFHTDVLIRLVEYKLIPLQAWTGPEGSGRLWLPDFKTIGK